MRLIIVPTVLTLSMLALAACGGRFTGAPFGDSSVAVSSADASAAHAFVDLGSGDPESIDETYQQMDALMGEAYDELARVVADVWGQEHMEMPSRKVFIQYEDDITQRTVIDFEKGELRVERLAQPGEDEAEAMKALRAAVDQAMHATAMDMAETDTLMKYAKKMAGDKGISMAEMPDRTLPDEPVLEDILPKDVMKGVDEEMVAKILVVGDDGKKRMMVSYTAPFIPGFHGKLAARYADFVMKVAQEHDVPASVIMAVIQTESAFNPRARSHIPAYGLMQIVPRSAGKDVSQYIYGQARLLTPEELYDSDRNIHYGTVYLKILDNRYLRAIEDPESRLYSVIAAYNTGAGNIARAFTGTTRVGSAARVINTLTPDQVFDHLKTNLPFEETQRYIVKVTDARTTYLAWDN